MQDIWVVKKCEVKMAGYWPRSFLGVFIEPRWIRDPLTCAKIKQGQYLAILTEQALIQSQCKIWFILPAQN